VVPLVSPRFSRLSSYGRHTENAGNKVNEKMKPIDTSFRVVKCKIISIITFMTYSLLCAILSHDSFVGTFYVALSKRDGVAAFDFFSATSNFVRYVS